MDVVSFFAGCGGLDLGFEQSGFHVVWANELDPMVRDTYVRNHPNTKFVLGDIRMINPDEVPYCDGFIGGPPCQSWSVAGKQKGLEDQRGQLFLTYIDMIVAKSPKFFLIENVKGLLDEKFKNIFNDFIFRLDAAGYNVQWKLLDAVNYRVPQNRERIFIIGFRKDLNVLFEFPNPTCFEPIPLIKAIGDITEEPRQFLNEGIDKVNPIRPNHDVYSGAFSSYYRRGNRRRSWERPSFTIHATGENTPLHPSSPKMVYYGHENWNFLQGRYREYRRLSVRECARIQTFPDDFIFDCPDIKALYRMIGNAVPPRMANILAKAILSAITNVKFEYSLHTRPVRRISQACVLVGYFKNERHRALISENLLYYVRSDGRKGSVFKDDCSAMPEYLLLHHDNKVEIYELEPEEPILAEASFLMSLGFDVSGKTYLCFRLKSANPLNIRDLGGYTINPNFNSKEYSPYFTTIENVFRI